MSSPSTPTSSAAAGARHVAPFAKPFAGARLSRSAVYGPSSPSTEIGTETVTNVDRGHVRASPSDVVSSLDPQSIVVGCATIAI
jgi:hypothetical protein